MGMVFKQLAGTAASALDACNVNDHDVAATASKWGAQVDGSTAATQYTLIVPGIDTGADSVVLLAQWESEGPEYGSPGETVTWEAGNWICRVNVSQANSNVYWDSVEICAYQGGSTTAIASKTGIATSLSSTGTYAETITTTSASTVPLGATILWSFYFGQTIATARGNTFKIRSNRNLATPIENKRGVTVVSFASAPVLPGTSFGGLSVAAPAATFASAATAPAAVMGTVSVAAPVASFASASTAPAVTPGTANIAAPSVALSSAAAAPGTTFGTASVPVQAVSVASSATPPIREGDEPIQSYFRPHMSANRMNASVIATGEFAKSMLDACGAQAWVFASSMPERYYAHAITATANALSQSQARRQRIARAAQQAVALESAARMRRPQASHSFAQAGRLGGGAVERAKITSGRGDV